MPRLSQEAQRAIEFAGIVTTYDLSPRDLAELFILSKQYTNAAERATGIPDYSTEPHENRLEKQAEIMGLTITYPGLVPRINTSQGFSFTPVHFGGER